MNFQAELAHLTQAVEQGQLTPAAAENIRCWLQRPHYASYAPQIAQHIADEAWQQLDDVFWTIIPFGTGGRRGTMYPIGSNAINDRTIGESAQGLANYVLTARQQGLIPADRPPSCAIAYDTRHRSDHFARLCSEILAAAGFKIYFLRGYRSTPELSFAVRYKQCDCGIMVTASHNPPSDNAVKVYWSTGGQLLPPHDQGVIDCVMSVEEIRRLPWEQAVSKGLVEECQDEVDEAFFTAVLGEAIPGPRDLKIVYSPLHGVGGMAVCPVLERDKFTDVTVYPPHAEPDGDFPNVPGHVANPENDGVFDAIIEYAQEQHADLVIASDPDCDRIGCAAPLTLDAGSGFRTLTGNQIGGLLADFLLEQRQTTGVLSADDYVVITLLTTRLTERIAHSYGVRCIRDLLVGFKWIAGAVDEHGPEHYVFGTEESYGYQAGTYTRDKDGAVAAMLLSELTARLKANGQTLHEKLDALFWQHGAHAERTISVMMPGSEGMQNMQALMERFRNDPPDSLGGSQIAVVKDYLHQTATPRDGASEPFVGPQSNLVFLELAAEGNYVAVRPSGTEPKVKFYLFTYTPPEQLANLEDAKAELQQRLDAIEQDVGKFAG